MGALTEIRYVHTLGDEDIVTYSLVQKKYEIPSPGTASTAISCLLEYNRRQMLQGIRGKTFPNWFLIRYMIARI